MSPVLSFQQRAARVLAADEVPPLPALDALITDGCAEALQIETRIARLTRRREASLNGVDDPGKAREVVELGDELTALEERLNDVQDAVAALMRRRSRQRLSDFMARR